MPTTTKFTEYYQSGRQIANARRAGIKAIEKVRELKKERIEKYLSNPSRCNSCNLALGYDQRKNKFCDKSCAAKFNNQLRPSGHISRVQNNESRRDKLKSHPRKSQPVKKELTYCRIQIIQCQNCSKPFIVKNWQTSNLRKTCSKHCATHLSVGVRSYPNGRRKITWYYNQYQNQEVLLESSWEVDLAKWLDEQRITWIRPFPIEWIDQFNKPRLYYPDFYLPDFNLYADPKNPYGVSIDQYKISQVSKTISLVYGDLSNIKTHILSLVHELK